MNQFFDGTRLSLLCAIGLAGAMACGGGGGGSSGPVSISGVVTLPPGSTIAPETLTVSSARGDVAVGSDGGFKVSEPPGGGPATIVVTDKNGKLVLLGHVDSDNPAFNDVSVLSTAEELLFLSTVSFMLPAEQWPQVYALLAAAPETATVAAVIATRFVASPTAVGDGDAEIQAAVAAATTALLTAPATAASTASFPSTAASASASASPGTSQRSSALAAAAKPVSVLVESADPYGLSVRKSLDGLGIYIENSKRIHRRYFVFRSGAVPSTGRSTDPPMALPTWMPVADGFLPATTGVTGIASSLIDYFSGKVAWAAKNTPTIPLPLDPSDAKANAFKAYVVGPGTGDVPSWSVSEPPLHDLVTLQPILIDTLAAAQRDAALLTWGKEIVWPLLTKVVPSGFLGNFNDDKKFLPVLTQIAKEAANFELNLDPLWQQGDFKVPTSEFFKFLASSKAFKGIVFDAIYNFLNSQSSSPNIGTNFVSTWASIFGDLVGYLNLVDKVLTLTDAGSVAYQVSQSASYNSWNVTAVPPLVAISPKTATIAAGGMQKFQTTVGGGLSNLGSLLYTFTCSAGTLAGIGTDGDRVSPDGHQLISNGAAVVYTSPSGATPGSTDMLTVSVRFDPATGPANNGYDVGTDSAAVTIGSPGGGCPAGSQLTVSYSGMTIVDPRLCTLFKFGPGNIIEINGIFNGNDEVLILCSTYFPDDAGKYRLIQFSPACPQQTRFGRAGSPGVFGLCGDGGPSDVITLTAIGANKGDPVVGTYSARLCGQTDPSVTLDITGTFNLPRP